ncbi:XdhC Rossmann domain protein (plasmid) [Caballeronia sp. SBC1]|uniref:XdhC family protein n=1 Tax=unclassified Caballeronia TaxID=2646786 RepID=UPI0013E1A782|nr:MULTISPECIES: XdhC family protein [unclassified Caballeronia]QIE27646.1 XdhC Rossmann domain protein [Caballeronia sp. SBC2]QIN65714.1 XdhC Rossmann domain protein [Caballeronia sp. SBC1]
MSADTLLQLEQRLIAEAQPFAVVTVIRAGPPTSAWVGAQALVDGGGLLHGWIGGGCSRAIVIQAALEAIRSGQPKRIRISNEAAMPDADVELHTMPCASNGTLELFIQPTLPAPLVLVLGSTPTALEACVLAQRVGLRVCAAANVSAPLIALGLTNVIQGFNAEALAEVKPQLILVATQGDCDEDALEAALRTSASAVLLVASERKAEKLRDAMRSRGIAQERLKALHAPAGPHIHAHTPPEIALGAVAGLVTLRRELELAAADACARCTAGDNAVPSVPPCEAMASVEPVVPRYLNPVCGMPVDIALAKHVVDYGGQRVYFCCDGCKIEFEHSPDKYLAIARGRREREKT